MSSGQSGVGLRIRMTRRVVLDARLAESEKIAGVAALGCFKNEILQYLQDLERKSGCEVRAVMIDNQPEIRWNMRPYVMDFLVELHVFLRLSPETLFLASFIADKYCSRRIVYKRHYQLLVTTALWIAAKFQDKKTRVPTLKELAMLCHQIYDPQMILQMERHILTTLNWCVGGCVSTLEMAQCILSSANEETIPQSQELVGLVRFLCDLSLYRRDFMCLSSSTKAVTAVLLACRILNVGRFSEMLSRLMVCSAETEDGGFNIMDDPTTGDVSLTMNKQNTDSVRKCLHVFLKDIFDYRMGPGQESISSTLLRKYKHLSIQAWLTNYRSNNFQIYAQLSSFNDSLKLANVSPYSSASDTFFRESVCSCLDEIAGFKNICKTNYDLQDSPGFRKQPQSSPFTPISSFSSIDLNTPTRWNSSTPPSSRSSVTQSCLHNPNTAFAVYPTTPSSTSSIFSAVPRLSATSRSSSLSSLPCLSNAKTVSNPCSKGSILNIKKTISAQNDVPGTYE